MLQRSMFDLCVFWQRGSWQYRPSALGKNLHHPCRHARHPRPLLVSFRPEKQKAEFPSAAPRSPALTGNKRHLRTSTRLWASAPRRWKRSRTQTCSGDPAGPSRRSSLLRALCFRLVPLFLRWGNVFVRWQTVRLRCHWVILTASAGKSCWKMLSFKKTSVSQRRSKRWNNTDYE